MTKNPAGLAVLCLLALGLPTSLSAQGLLDRFSVSPWVGVAFHGGYFDDAVVTQFRDEEEVDADLLDLDPGTSAEVGGSVAYRFSPLLSFYGTVAFSWPDADTEVNRVENPDLDMVVRQFGAGGLIHLEAVPGIGDVVPLYVGGGFSVTQHDFDDLRWRGQPVGDVTTSSFGLDGRIGADFPILPNLSFRGEISQSLIWGATGDLEEGIERATSADEGRRADVDLDGETFSIFRLRAGLRLEL